MLNFLMITDFFKEPKRISKWAFGLAIFLALFFELFALDVFEMPNWPIALLMHSLPSLLIFGLAFLGKKNNLWGCIGFLAVAIFFCWQFNINLGNAILILPLFAVSFLFFWAHQVSNKTI